MSLSVAIQVNALDAMPAPLAQGARVVLQAKPVFWTQRGSLMLDARQIRPVGVGELLARVEHLKRTLASEGLFDADRKRPLPFLPRTVGLVCGRASAAEKDVVENARRRWPTVRFDDPRGRRAGTAPRSSRGHGRAAGARRRPRGRRHRHRPRRRLRRGPAAVQQREPCCAPWPRPAPRSSAPSATTSTPRCSTTSPTGAPPPPPTRASAWCPTPQAERQRHPPVRATAAGAPLPAGSPASAATSSRCAPARSWPTPPP